MRTAGLVRVVSIGSFMVLAGAAAAAAGDDGLKLPAGFSATVVHEGQGTGATPRRRRQRRPLPREPQWLVRAA